MALSIKTAEADELARSLARLTGETMTEAVTAALRERLARERDRRSGAADLPQRLAALSGRMRARVPSTTWTCFSQRLASSWRLWIHLRRGLLCLRASALAEEWATAES